MLKLFFLVVIVGICAANSCGGNCPSGNCPYCPCGTDKAFVDAGAFCSRYSDWGQGCCRCIIQHESSGNAHAANHNSNGSMDVGLFQVNSVNWQECSGGNAPCDTELVHTKFGSGEVIPGNIGQRACGCCSSH